MKLYTEQDIRIAIAMGYDWRDQKHIPQDHMIDNFINSLTPIELPSDEEIDIYVKSTGYYGHCTTEYREGIEEGAKWMRDKIQVGKP